MCVTSILSTILALFAMPHSLVNAQDPEKQWQRAVKETINFTADLLEKKVRGDKEAVNGLRKLKKELLEEKKIEQASEEMEKKYGAGQPTKEQLEKLHTDIKKKIEKANEAELKEALRKGKVPPSLELPPPFGPG
jgi:hypothetical protein